MFTPEEVKEGLTSAQAKEYGKKSVQFLRKQKPNSCFVSVVDYTFKDGKKGSLFMAGTELECKSLFVALKRVVEEKNLAMGSAELKAEKGQDEVLKIDRSKGKAGLKKLERQANKVALSSTTVECQVKGSEDEVEENAPSLNVLKEVDARVDDEEMLSKKERAELAREESPNVKAKISEKERAELKARLEKLMTEASVLVKALNENVRGLRASEDRIREMQEFMQNEPENSPNLPKAQKIIEEAVQARKKVQQALVDIVQKWEPLYDAIEDTGEVKLKEQLANAHDMVQRVKSKFNVKIEEPKAPEAPGDDDLRQRVEAAFDEAAKNLNPIISKNWYGEKKPQLFGDKDKVRFVDLIIKEKREGKRTFSAILGSVGATRNDSGKGVTKQDIANIIQQAKLVEIGKKYGLE